MQPVEPAVPGADPASLLVPGRDCETCSMCCKVFRVPEVDKLPGDWCRHVIKGVGCGIHATRPQVCREFFCHYLRNPNLGPEWRPDRSKFVLYTEMAGRRLVVASDPSAPLAWRKAPFYAQFKRWASIGIQKNHQVLVFNGKRTTAVLPDRDEDLGAVDLGDEVIYHLGPARIDVEVRRQPLPESSAPRAG